MNVTDEEKTRFLRLVHPAYRSDMIDILSNMHVSIIRTNIKIEGSNDGCYDNFITATGKNYNTSDFKVIRLNPTFAQFKKDDAAFIIAFISRCFDKLKLIFSSSVTHVFIEDINGMKAVLGTRFDTFSDGEPVADIFSHNRRIVTLYLAENNADVSDDIWNVILSGHGNANRILSAYVSGAYCVSDNIKKRIRLLYESLPDSYKLLLELGEDI